MGVSPSVQDAADATVNAQKAVDRLQAALEAEKTNYENKFFAQINENFAKLGINDAQAIDYNYSIKTEYTSEFSLDKIVGIVTAALQAAIAAQNPLAAAPATSPEALNAYSDVVVKVGEAAKSSSQSAASLSFSMNRLSPGLFAFLYAASTNITDEALFGTEAVTSTVIFYRFMQSIEDIKRQAAFGEAVIDYENLMNMKTLQAGLTDRLAKGEITVNDWQVLDGQYSGMIQTIRNRLNSHQFPPAGAPEAERLDAGSDRDRSIVSDALEQLSSMGDAFAGVVKISKERLESHYY